MQSNPNHESFWIIAFSEQQLELMNENCHKLHHLECGQVFLPPNIFLVFWSHGGNHIVKVHNNMHKTASKVNEERKKNKINMKYTEINTTPTTTNNRVKSHNRYIWRCTIEVFGNLRV